MSVVIAQSVAILAAMFVMGLSQTLSSCRAIAASFLLVAIIVCLSAPTANAGPAVYYGKGGKVRTIRGFKNVVLSTARNFGKRDPNAPSDEVAVDMSGDPTTVLAASSPNGSDLSRPRGVPVSVEWFVEAIASNPDFARAIIRKYLDDNKDGELSPEELLRTTY